MRRVCFGLFLVIVGSACGGTLSLTEYATRAEQLVIKMESDFAGLDAEWVSQPPTVDRAADYWEGRLAVRDEFLEAIEALDPPAAVVDQHLAALDVFGRMTAADEALAARVNSMGDITDHWQWRETTEGRAVDAILEEVFAFCRASQADYDATRDRAALEDVPWIPSEMSEVVSVAFGCPP